MKKIVLIVGPSGSGKSTLIAKTFNEKQYIRSTTTRPMRIGEQNGKDYLFVSKNEFLQKIKNDGLVQYVKYDNNYYGVTKDEIQLKLLENDVVASPVIYSAVKSFVDYAEAHEISHLTVFTDISKKTLIKHFESRTDTLAEKQDRISRYDEEIKIKKHFDTEHILNMNIDDHASTASKKLNALINK